MRKTEKVTVGMRMPVDVRDAVRQLARRDRRTFSGEMEVLIARGMMSCMQDEVSPHGTMIAPDGGDDNGV